MNKKIFQKIIQAGFIKSHSDIAVMFYDNDRNLHCEFYTNDREMVCEVIADKFNDGNNFLGDKKIGIPDLDYFMKILKALGNEINITIETVGRNEKRMILSDSMLEMKHSLIIDSQLPDIPLPNYSKLSMTSPIFSIDKDFISKFYKISGAIKDCKYLFVRSSGKNLELTLSQSDTYETGVKIPIRLEAEGDDVEPMKFIMKNVRMAMYNSRSIGNGKIQAHNAGMLFIMFNEENLKINYYLLGK